MSGEALDSGHKHNHGPNVRSLAITGPGSKTRVLGIASGKGGVGKSTVAVNLAVALHQLSFDVSVLDADVYGFSVPHMLGMSGQPEVVDHHVLVPPRNHGVGCISMGFFAEDDQPLIWRGPMLHKALNQFLVDVAWGEPDFLIVDLPPGTGDVALSMAQLLPSAETYVVTTPQLTAQRVAQRSGVMAKQSKVPLRGVIENMSPHTDSAGNVHDLFGSGGGRILSEMLDVALVGQIPLERAVREGGDAGIPITVSNPAAASSQAFRALAATVSTSSPTRVFHEELRMK